MVIPQVQLQEEWILRISKESRKVQTEWVRACSQWLCGLFPWDGRELATLARSTMDSLWNADPSPIDWNKLSQLIAAEIPREDTIDDFGLPDAIFEAAMATLSYTCKTMTGDFETSVQLVTTWMVDAIFAPIEMMSTSYEEQDKILPDPTLLKKVLENRLSRNDLIVHARTWRKQTTSI